VLLNIGFDHVPRPVGYDDEWEAVQFRSGRWLHVGSTQSTCVTDVTPDADLRHADWIDANPDLFDREVSPQVAPGE
jgi:hypothetical protein